jgi:DNA adenine methylase
MPDLRAPFPYFGGKRTVAANVWSRLGAPRQYIEPFCGSAAILLAAPSKASLEVVNDGNGFIANFWRATKYQPDEVARWADYPVSHIDMGAAHFWLMEQRQRIGDELQDIEWPGDAKAAGRWLHGQCCWIGSGWCEWDRAGSAGMGVQAIGQVPHAGNAGMGVQAIGQVPHAGNAGMGVQAIGKVPHAGNAGMGVDSLLTSSGRAAWAWLHKLSTRLERVRIVHGDWSRCLNSHFGGDNTAVFLDPPYRAYERLYGDGAPVADAVEAWARDNANLKIALCGHVGDYDLPEWDAIQWSRGRSTYGSTKTIDSECIWYSPACVKSEENMDLFAKQESFL